MSALAQFSLPSLRVCVGLLVAAALTACATPANNYDPLESINRPIYSLNKTVDNAVVRPVAKAWSEYLPNPVQKGVHNVFSNIGDVFAIPAALLQGKGEDSIYSVWRVVLNTTVGIGGIFDVASEIGIKKSEEDFGQALGYWGVPSGPYLMLPFMGPATARDVIDPAVKLAYGPTNYIEPDTAAMAYVAVNVIDTRVQYLPVDKLLDEQYDPYAYLRDTYLQNRWYKVHDGNPPSPLKMAADVDDELDLPSASAPEASPASGVAGAQP